MKRSLAAGLVWLLMPAIASAQTDPTPLADFTSLCEETASTGFNWKDGAWVQVNFKPRKYLVRKVSNAADRPQLERYQDDGCSSSKRSTEWNLEGIVATADGCYSIANVGEKPSFEWCGELYGQQGNGWEVLNITCSGSTNFYFAPDGLFHRSSIHGEVTPSPVWGGKDSLAVSHGKCTIIQ